MMGSFSLQEKGHWLQFPERLILLGSFWVWVREGGFTTFPTQPLQSRSTYRICSSSGRPHVFKEDDGEAWGPQDTPGDEEDDLGGDRWGQRHHLLPRLCERDARETVSCPQAVST